MSVDPWLKKSKAKANKKEKKRKEKEKQKKQKKKKDKKDKKKKKKKSKHQSDESGDEFDDIDKKFDEALAAAGLKGEVRESTPLSSMINAPRDVGQDAVERAISMKRELLEKIERLGDLLPPNTLDELIDSLGGPENVAEVCVKRYNKIPSIYGTYKSLMFLVTFLYIYNCFSLMYFFKPMFAITHCCELSFSLYDIH